MEDPSPNTPAPKRITLEEIENDMFAKMKADHNLVHYKCRAECFIDTMRANKNIFDWNEAHDDKLRIPIICPNIKASVMGDTEFDFWTDAPYYKVLHAINVGEEKDLHRMVQTLKPIEKYDGVVDNTMWDNLEKLEKLEEKHYLHDEEICFKTFALKPKPNQ
jgi:hypothetical protein